MSEIVAPDVMMCQSGVNAAINQSTIATQIIKGVLLQRWP
jgi:hypothetical protein